MRHWSSAFLSIRDAMKPHTVGIALMRPVQPGGPIGQEVSIGGVPILVAPARSGGTRLCLTGIEVRKPGGRCAVAFCQLTRLCTYRLIFGEVCHKLRFLPTLHRQAGSFAHPPLPGGNTLTSQNPTTRKYTPFFPGRNPQIVALAEIEQTLKTLPIIQRVCFRADMSRLFRHGRCRSTFD